MKCFGVCEGNPAWRSPKTGLCCCLCGGSGMMADAPSFGEKCEEIAKRGRLSHSAIVAGDTDEPSKAKPRKRWVQRRPRMTKARRIAAANVERRQQAERDRREFKATRPADWDKQLDDLKSEFRRGNKR